jgi:hypothetical protein
LLKEIDRAADVYKSFVVQAAEPSGAIDRLGLFVYRTGVLESEVIKPLVLYLLNPEEPPIPEGQLLKSLGVIESWMVRRMLVRATTQSYSQIVAETITQLRKNDRDSAGDVLEAFFAGQTSGSRYWPDDDEVREELKVQPAYRRLGRGRLRMVLEGIEDYLRGWRDDEAGMGGERVSRGMFHLEHVMPQKWAIHWPLPEGSRDENERDHLIHTMGNMTLLTARLNTKVSNGPWLGPDGKKHGLEAHDVLLLNREILRTNADAWTDTAIRARSEKLAKLILEIWPAPEGHRSGFSREKVTSRHRVDLSDLISTGWLEPGRPLFARRQKFADVFATLLPDGRLDIGGVVYATPSEAAKAVTGQSTNGWWFFLADKPAAQSIRDVRREYLESFAADLEEEDADDEVDDEA